MSNVERMSLRRNHLPGLDGLRALAVLAVLAYHLDFGFAKGGFLGVDLFFVLSGFLITTLLLEEKLETGSIVLMEFWRRRARRLLPALFLMVAIVVAWPWIASELGLWTAVSNVDVGQLRGFGFASLFYYANWFVISSGHSYFNGLSAQSPLVHTWSLAIEEQFYLVWPLLTLALVRGGVVLRRKIGIGLCIAIAVCSSVAMALIFDPSSPDSANFVYNASFTRLFDLAVGAALAWLVVSRPSAPTDRRWSDPVGLLALAGLAVAFVFAGSSNGSPGNAVPRNFMFQGGFLLCAIAAALVIAAVRVEGSWIARVFSWRPLRAVGQVSYGIYLWHWPVITYVTTASSGLAGKKLLIVRLVLIAIATVASYFLIEMPIRRRRWKPSIRRSVAVIGTAAPIVVVAVLTLSSIFPVVSLSTEVVRYSPSNPPRGSGGVQGSISAAWLGAHGPTKATPLKILVIGDSMPYLSEYGILAAVNAMPNVHARVSAYPTFGLRTSSYRRFYLRAIQRWHPGVVIFIDHADEPTAASHPGRYETEVSEFVRSSFANGVHDFIFATTPRQHTPSTEPFTPQQMYLYDQEFHRQNIAWRHAVLAVMHQYPGQSAYFPLNRSLEVHGQYVTWMAPPRHPKAPRTSWARVRMTDGIHMCPIGTEIYASALTADLASALGINGSRSGWWNGKWPYEGRRLSTNATLWCPLDHPKS
jgi:peptidoglycan/LPS O-acetylase OafA/YrhL